MTDLTTLRDLAERVAGLTGADREVDLALAKALVPDVIVLRQRNDDSGADPFTYWEYTASVDSALALVERVLPGWGVRLSIPASADYASCEMWLPHPWADAFGKSATPPLAIVLATLRALIAKEESRG